MVDKGLSTWGGARVLIVGDVMLDRYWFGGVNRISPEAPVPVVKVDRQDVRPGGAANVARNVTALGTQACLLSVVGDDDAGRTLRSILEDAGVSTGFKIDTKIDTTVKLRVVALNQQLLRIDFETAPSHEILRDKLKDYEARLGDCDVVVLSDYGKGGLTHIAEMIRLAREAGKPVFVDPKGDDYEKYRGATVITPNRSELRQVVGAWSSEEELHRKAEALRERLGASALLLTRSEEGMTLFEAGTAWNQPAQAREVFDVSGAGDTVIATLASAVATGYSLRDAVRLANTAAGIVVGKLGTAVVTYEELQAGQGSLPLRDKKTIGTRGTVDA